MTVMDLHSGTATTETIYRKQIRPVIIGGAEVMDRLSPGIPQKLGRMPPVLSYSVGYSIRKGHDIGWSVMAYELVGVAGFEPAASSSRTKRAAKLRYTPAPRADCPRGEPPPV